MRRNPKGEIRARTRVARRPVPSPAPEPLRAPVRALEHVGSTRAPRHPGDAPRRATPGVLPRRDVSGKAEPSVTRGQRSKADGSPPLSGTPRCPVVTDGSLKRTLRRATIDVVQSPASMQICQFSAPERRDGTVQYPLTTRIFARSVPRFETPRRRGAPERPPLLLEPVSASHEPVSAGAQSGLARGLVHAPGSGLEGQLAPRRVATRRAQEGHPGHGLRPSGGGKPSRR